MRYASKQTVIRAFFNILGKDNLNLDSDIFQVCIQLLIMTMNLFKILGFQYKLHCKCACPYTASQVLIWNHLEVLVDLLVPKSVYKE